MQPPIGVSHFREMIEHRDFKGLPYLFVDKSLFIKDLLEDSAEVKLITRPRRFGKTLNMSMLHHFFAKELDNKETQSLFNGLKIAQYEQHMKYQGQFPVIFMTFKDIKNNHFKAAYEDICELIRNAYLEHEEPVLSSQQITDREKRDYEDILDRKAPDTAIRSALKNLTTYLNKAYGVKPMVLIDEYDTPIQTAYLGKFYQDMITFMREFFGAGLKDNASLERAVLTGVLRVSKESIFSGLNNIKTYSLLNSRYGEYFGFTEVEVIELLEKSALNTGLNEVKHWYNGYQIGNAVMYNPWSIVNYIQEQGKLGAYWVNTSDNAFIKDLLVQSSTSFKTEFESLLQDNPIEMLINEQVTFDNLSANESAIWALLLMSGYLKATPVKEAGEEPLYQLQIPNKEVIGFYRTLIAEWLSGVNNATVFNTFLSHLLKGEMEEFENHLERMMIQTFSVHDIKGKHPENFYHGFMLGLVSFIHSDHYIVHSNKESGLGRYDIILIPKDPKNLGIIFEIKSVEKSAKDDLKKFANEAIDQIDRKKYVAELLQHKVKNWLKIGIAFCGKECAVVYRKNVLS